MRKASVRRYSLRCRLTRSSIEGDRRKVHILKVAIKGFPVGDSSSTEGESDYGPREREHQHTDIEVRKLPR